MNEEAWNAVPALPVSQYQPDPGGPMRDRSEIRIAYDDAYLYASGRFWDAEPDAIRSNSLLRDYYAEDDYLNLVIDTFSDRENAVWFVVTPNATRIDGSLSNNAEGLETQWNHPEYDMAWDAAAVRTAEGWSVEVRIPLSTLRFDAHDGRVTMGLIAARLISRRKERHIFPAIRPTVAVAQFKPALAAPVTMQLATVPRFVTVTPYVLAGSQVRRPGASGSVLGVGVPADTPRAHALRELGADLKLGLSSRVTLDVTLNTDFAQTEVDDQRVNLTRFSLFFPERRQFFLERAGLFDVRTGDDDRVFYSRRIGLSPDGEPVRVLGGGRIVGRVGPWDLGALDLMTDGAAASTTNAAVVRVRRNVLNPYSYIGVIATSLDGGSVTNGRSLGADGTLRLSGADYLVWSAVSTWDGQRTQRSSTGDATAVRAAAEHRRRSGLSAAIEARLVGADYAPPLGFVGRSDIALGTLSTTYGWVGPRGPTQERSTSLSGTVVRRLSTGELETVSAGPSASVVFVGGANATLSARLRREMLADTFHLGLALVPPGRHDWGEVALSAGTSPGGLARVRVGVEGGGFYDGHRATIAVRPAWNASRHIELTGDLELNRIWLPKRGQRFAGDVARLRARVAFDPRLSLSGAAQYNRAAGVMTGSLRLRYAMREGTDLFVVVDDERLDREQMIFGLPSARGARFVAAKCRYTFR